MAFKEEDYRGVPCILVYSKTGTPVPKDNPEKVSGGRAPHHANSTGYVYAENDNGNKFDRYAHVFEMEWQPMYEPDCVVVYAREKRGKQDWQEVGKFDLSNSMAEFAAIGMAHVYQRDYSLKTRIVAEKRNAEESKSDE
jgi:hypothetical protein